MFHMEKCSRNTLIIIITIIMTQPKMAGSNAQSPALKADTLPHGNVGSDTLTIVLPSSSLRASFSIFSLLSKLSFSSCTARSVAFTWGQIVILSQNLEIKECVGMLVV